MNNAFVLNQEDEIPENVQTVRRERREEVIKIVEALQNIGGSSYWIVLKQLFEVELDKAKKSLAKSSDTNDMFRLQGELRWEDKINLDKQLAKYRHELETINKQLNG